MLRVNLLPWRERQRQRGYRLWTRVFMIGMAAIAAALLLAGFFHRQLNQQRELSLKRQSDYRTALQSQFERVNALELAYRRAEQINVQMEQRFDRSLQYVQLLRHLSQVMPQQVWATRLSQNAANVVLEGRSANYEAVLALDSALPHDALFPRIQLREVKQLPAEELSFSLNATLQSAEGE